MLHLYIGTITQRGTNVNKYLDKYKKLKDKKITRKLFGSNENSRNFAIR